MNHSLMEKIQAYFLNNSADFRLMVAEHLWISFEALLISGTIGILCGYLCYRYSVWEKWLLGLFQVLRIIPSLAVLFLLIPFIGIGRRPALIALILLAIPPVLMNTVTGFKEIPEFMQETAKGLGMTERQSLWKVKVPLAMPFIMSGLKIAMIEIIASATLAAKIGAGGLGGLIFTGLGLNRMDLLLIGGLSVAGLSLTAGIVLDLADKWMFQYRRKIG